MKTFPTAWTTRHTIKRRVEDANRWFLFIITKPQIRAPDFYNNRPYVEQAVFPSPFFSFSMVFSRMLELRDQMLDIQLSNFLQPKVDVKLLILCPALMVWISDWIPPVCHVSSQSVIRTNRITIRTADRARHPSQFKYLASFSELFRFFVRNYIHSNLPRQSA